MNRIGCEKKWQSIVTAIKQPERRFKPEWIRSNTVHL